MSGGGTPLRGMGSAVSSRRQPRTTVAMVAALAPLAPIAASPLGAFPFPRAFPSSATALLGTPPSWATRRGIAALAGMIPVATRGLGR